MTTSESHRARDCQHESVVGDAPGSLRSDPAGMMISRPLRVACGSGEPQSRQNAVEKLRAVARSKRATLSSPDNQRNACGKTYALAANALPVALRHRVDDGVLIESGAPTNGVVGGVLAGYNWQRGPLVLGIEGDFGWTNAHGNGNIPPPAVGTKNLYDARWDAHFVGKAGYAMGQWMIFGTGGLAVIDLDFQEGSLTPAPPVTGGKYVGFSVGGGVEYAFTRNLLGRLQYIYDDFGSKTYVAADGGIYRVSVTSQTFRGALSWKF